MLKPLEQFYCDTCGGIIETAKDGWIEWISYYNDNQEKCKDFRICHRDLSCQKLTKHPYRQDLPLSEIIGERATVYMARFLDVGPYHEENYLGPAPENFREFAKLMRRLTIPYYEEARFFWSKAITDGYFESYNEIYIYLPDNLKKMIEHYNK